MSKRFILAGAASVFLMGGAQAADIIEPTAYDWSGFYAGIHAGYGFSDDDAQLDGLGGPAWDPYYPVALGEKDLSADGFIGGVQAGYNHQLDSVVIGLEADFSYSDIGDDSDETSPPGYFDPFTYKQRYDLNWLGTVRIRAGYAFDRALIYATGGFAYGEVDVRHDEQFPVTRYQGDENEIEIGWTIGGGLEYALTDSWSIKGEYLYYDLGNTKSVADPAPPNPPFQQEFTTDNTGHIVRLGVNLHF